MPSRLDVVIYKIVPFEMPKDIVCYFIVEYDLDKIGFKLSLMSFDTKKLDNLGYPYNDLVICKDNLTFR